MQEILDLKVTACILAKQLKENYRLGGTAPCLSLMRALISATEKQLESIEEKKMIMK